MNELTTIENFNSLIGLLGDDNEEWMNADAYVTLRVYVLGNCTELKKYIQWYE
jgi:hypothetical protein